MKILIQKPTDQPTGKNRLLDQLKTDLKNTDLDDFRIIVAFAKLGPLLRLKRHIQGWKSSGKTIRAMIGIDEKGTSQQALEFALDNFDETYITHIDHGAFNSTFHSKIYLFKGVKKAIVYIGSNNLTVGGTELNSESNIRLELSLPEEKDVFEEVNNCWNFTKMIAKKLDTNFLGKLLKTGIVLDEKEMREMKLASRSTLPKPKIKKSSLSLPTIKVLPPSPLPKPIVKTANFKKPPASKRTPLIAKEKFIAQAFAIQIIPHHNGEVLLSKIAIDQNPDFFGFPFKGRTKPKKPVNQSYPQRVPDPVVNITVYGRNNKAVVQYEKYLLNTVYYSKKSEIRITVPQDVVKNVPPYSILVMGLAPEDETYDYDIEIFVPGSQKYNENLSACNQSMPSGGKESPRKFGWI